MTYADPHNRVRTTSTRHGGYKLTENQRLSIGLEAWLGLWTNTAIGAAYGIDRTTVTYLKRRALAHYAQPGGKP